MKLFISWSGGISHDVAKILRDWIPKVIQSVKPYVSSEDINKGNRWLQNIAGELDTSKFSIICVTHENIDSKWLNFEAGALSRSINQTNVAPFLFQLKPSDIPQNSPLVQFQMTNNDKEDIKKLINSINTASENIINQILLDDIFEVWWPKLEAKLKEFDESLLLCIDSFQVYDPDTIATNKILEELLEISRIQLQLLKNPKDLLPEKYFEDIIKNNELSSKAENKYRRGELFDLFRTVDAITAKLGQTVEAFDSFRLDMDVNENTSHVRDLNENYNALMLYLSKLKTFM